MLYVTVSVCYVIHFFEGVVCYMLYIAVCGMLYVIHYYMWYVICYTSQCVCVWPTRAAVVSAGS